MAKPLEIDEVWQERILSQVSGLQYGQVIITVHDGRIVQIDRTERTRYDTPSQRNAQPASQAPQSQPAAPGGKGAQDASDGESLRAAQ